MIDMHAHICSYDNPELALKELIYRSNAGIHTFFSTGTPIEYRYMLQLLKTACQATCDVTCNTLCRESVRTPLIEPLNSFLKESFSASGEAMNRGVCSGFRLTFGIHPWYADQWEPKDWGEYYQNVPMIGEIGMDNLWCDVPLDKQQRILEEQLTIAADLHKPVVLHTKGCEKRIAQIVKDYPYPVLVHWYSGDAESFDLFMNQGCFFTLGPDTGFFTLGPDTGLDLPDDSSAPSLLEHVPLDHLFVETDGLNAILWAYEMAGHTPPQSADADPAPGFSIIKSTLNMSVECTALHHGLTKEETLQQINQNLAAFCSTM